MMKRLIPLTLALLLACFGPAKADDSALSIDVDHGVPLALSAPANNVFIANPDVADIQVMSPTTVMVFGKKTGRTTLLATDSGGHTILFRTVIVTQDLSDLHKELTAAIPDNKIEVQSLPDAIVLTGEVRDPAAVLDAQKIAQRFVTKDGQVINRVRVVGSNQVMIRVRFAEVSRNVDRSFGIDWDSALEIGGMVVGLGTGAQIINIVGGTAAPSLTPTRPNNANLGQPNDLLSFQYNKGRYNLNGFIDALAQDGLVTILAEPNLTAMSGETANFLAGGEFPIPIPQANGTISIEFKPYGISLSFTPTIIGEDRINLHVKPEVSELTTVGEVTLNNITIPALTTRKAETTVEIASGQSFAIAGLLDNSQAQTVDKYPFLGDMPILGPLFRSTEFQNNQSELVVIITPYIVKAGASQQTMALPTDGFSPPSEAERLLGLRQSSGNSDARPMSGTALAKSAPAPSTLITPTSATPITPDTDDGFAAPLPPARNNLGRSASPEDAPAPTPAPVTPVAPATSSPSHGTGSGPGGFLLE